MLIARLVADSVQIVDKVKRKVRLASGLDKHNYLNDIAIARGIECLSFFAERLQDIPKENIRVVATATLRIAVNADHFLTQAEAILNHKITILTGKQEAEQIYLGVAHTNCSEKKRLVLDIGGASTEIIAGEGFTIKAVDSLNIGCVTFNNQFFHPHLKSLNQETFIAAINTAKKNIQPLVSKYKQIGWQSVLGGSGTMQALGEILNHQHKPAIINLTFLHEIKQQLINNQGINNIVIAGLSNERKPVIASGVAILIALFETLSIEKLQLSSGAIREGLLYEMLPNMREIPIRERTIKGLISRFHIDEDHNKRVLAQAKSLFNMLAKSWKLIEDNSQQLLFSSCLLHEIGLLLEFKGHQKHAAYILQHTDLAGFDQTDRELLVAFVKLYKGDIDNHLLIKQSATTYQNACRLLAILRLAIILCRRRRDDVLPCYQCSIDKQDNRNILLSLPQSWLVEHPLIADELKQESHYLQQLNLSLTIIIL